MGKFKFPLERGWYELWCQAWERGWIGSIGYSLDLSTGELSRFCVCAARSSSECICGDWDEEKNT